MVSVKEESVADIAAIDRVNELAFGRRAEADLVALLRRNKKIILSLAAFQEGQLVGHVLFSPMRIVAPSGSIHAAVGVGPVAVLPELQRLGIGSALMKAGLTRCRAAGHRVALVLGHPTYYPRFGFQPAVHFGIACAYDVPEDAFMALELQPGALANVSGVAHYEPEFDGV
jgi:putative acetyltransferase